MFIVAWVGDDSQHQQKSYPIRVLASCVNGQLKSAQTYKEFGNVIVGSSVTSHITVINNNDCALDFEIFIKQNIDAGVSSKKLDDMCVLDILDLDDELNEAANSQETTRSKPLRAHIEARSKLNLRCRIRPTRLINYYFTIEYRILYLNSGEMENRNSREVLCHISAVGVYPKLNVSDIKAIGSASNLSKDFLWRILSINE